VQADPPVNLELCWRAERDNGIRQDGLTSGKAFFETMQTARAL